MDIEIIKDDFNDRCIILTICIIFSTQVALVKVEESRCYGIIIFREKTSLTNNPNAII